MPTSKLTGFEVSTSARDDGTIEAIYIRLSRNKIASTIEVKGAAEVLADYDSKGKNVGMEILSPVRLPKIVRLVDEPRRRPFRRFAKSAAPPELICA